MLGIGVVLYYIELNPALYSLVLFSIFLFLFLLHRDRMYDIFDPFVLAIFGEGFAISVPVFMLLTKIVDLDIYIISFLLTFISFHFGLLKCKRYSYNFKEGYSEITPKYYVDNDRFKPYLFTVFFTAYFLIKLYSYTLYGIGLAYENHVEAIKNIALINFLENSLVIIILLYCWERVLKFKKRKYYFIIAFLSCMSLLSGAKSSLLVLGNSLFYYKLYISKTNDKTINTKKIYQFILPICISGVMFLLFYYDQSKNIAEIFTLFIRRLFFYGDAYANVYWDKDLLHYIINKYDFYDLIINPILATYRLVPWSGMTAVGNEIINYSLNVDTSTAGPNNRYILFWLLCFGPFFSVAAAYCHGLFISYVVNKMFFVQQMDIFSFYSYIILYSVVISSITDPSFFVEYLRFLPFLFFLYCLLQYFITKKIRLHIMKWRK